jgi:hypothetical protein
LVEEWGGGGVGGVNQCFRGRDWIRGCKLVKKEVEEMPNKKRKQIVTYLMVLTSFF